MAKKRYSFDNNTKARREKQGRGKGEEADYKPWLEIHTVPSEGRARKVKGIKTGRIHHVLSDIEYHLFLLLDWSEHVVDIREQFPLDRDSTVQIADALKVAHPLDSHTRELVVVTTDFLVDFNIGGRRFQRAYAVKPAKHLGDTRKIEKLEIERRYWERLNVDWKIVTNLDLPPVWVDNVKWVHNHFWFDAGQEPYEGFNQKGSIAMLDALENPLDQTVSDFCQAMDLQLRCAAGASLKLFRHLLARRAVYMPIDCEVNARTPISVFKVAARAQAASA